MFLWRAMLLWPLHLLTTFLFGTKGAKRKVIGQKHSRLERERVAHARYSLFFPIFASASSSTGRADVKIKRTSCGGWYKVFTWSLCLPRSEFGIPERVATSRTVGLRNREVETLGRQATACFFFIVKAKIKFACFIYNKKHNIHLYSREADSLPYR